jgi:uncharacterized membrane protein YphA (DoxX/SURF4 family)
MANAAVSQLISTDLAPDRPAPCSWSLAHRVVFRFLFSYFVLYALPDSGRISILNTIPGTGLLSKQYVAMWHALCPWVAIHVFHLSGQPVTYFLTGSGDTTLGYIQNLLFVVVALIATLVWSLADYKRRHYSRLDAWLRILVRYTLAFTLFGYGFAKVFPLQFATPGFLRLIEPYGDFSPMGSLWWFMGASLPYVMFSGAAEVLGGLLLLFRRTTTLGALVSFAVLLNVAVLNYCYDVPVKLYSTNLVLMAVFLAARDLRRLFDFFVFNRPTSPADLIAPRFGRRWLRVATMVFPVLFVGYHLFGQIKGDWDAYKARYINPQRPPLYGLYEVESFVRNGRELPPLVTDATRWRKLVVQSQTALNIKMMDDSITNFGTEYDAAKNTVSLTVGSDKSKKYPLAWSRPDADHLLLEGALAKDALSVRLRKIDTSTFRLLSRGYHWINELPFNR